MSNREHPIPIKSPSDEKIILEQLYKKNVKYYLVAKTILETDIPFTNLVDLKVKDLYGKNELCYRSKNGIERRMPLSDELQNHLKLFLSNLDSDQLIFTGSYSGDKLQAASVQVVFNSVRKSCNLPYCLTMTTLHMTFLYHMLKNDGNIVQLRQYMHASSSRYVYNYLSLPIPESREEDPIIYERKFLDRVHMFRDVAHDTQSIISHIQEQIENPNNLTRASIEAYLAYQRALSEANYNLHLMLKRTEITD